MPKSTTSTDRVANALTAITRAADALFKHTSKAVAIQDITTRTTVMGRGTGPDALPAKDEVSALFQSMPGCADDDHADAADAKGARSKIVKSVGGFVKTAVKKSAGKIADALTDSALAPLEKLHSNNLKSVEAIVWRKISCDTLHYHYYLYSSLVSHFVRFEILDVIGKNCYPIELIDL